MQETDVHLDYDALARTECEAVRAALSCLNERLPLVARQRALPRELRLLHRTILLHLLTCGCAPGASALAQALSNVSVSQALDTLAGLDLIVLGRAHGQILGAYPVTTEDTGHRVQWRNATIGAMCAVDALAVSPMVSRPTEIVSSCAHTGRPIHLEQNGLDVWAPHTDDTPRVGIHWRDTDGCAAHSLCREMVFLADVQAAAAWQGMASGERKIYSLADATGLAARFFMPLIAHEP